MNFFHRTSEEAWKLIQEEGVLWGVTSSYRFTYLSPLDFGESYGPVLLQVEYDPSGPPKDNYGFNPPEGQICWQFSVFDPIPIEKVVRIG